MKQKKCGNPYPGDEDTGTAPITDWRGHPLPMGRSKADRRARLRHYLLSSLIGGLAYAILDILLWGLVENTVLAGRIFPGLSNFLTLLITAAVTFVVVFLGVFLFQYLTGEFVKVRRYNQLIAHPNRRARRSVC